VSPVADVPANAPSAEAVMARAAGENFPVASRLLPARARGHLLALYGFARLVDELGDAPRLSVEERIQALDWLEGELDRALQGSASHPLLVRLGDSIRACGLGREPFARLIRANRADQRVTRYETWEQLRGYCALSADPVGELVLGVLGLATPARIALSDSICTALQLAEHCQDVAEDLASGRIYLPAEDMRRFGCEESDLAAAHANAAVRELIAFEVARARNLFDAGAPLLAQLHGRPRLAIAAFLGGGRAATDAIEGAAFDVLAGAPQAGRKRRLLATLAALRGPTASAPAAGPDPGAPAPEPEEPLRAPAAGGSGR
jgi:squalene synthase HpnC